MQRGLVDGLSVGHRLLPSGPIVIFVHGVMDRGATFLNVTRGLDSAWLIYDRRGYGRSEILAPPLFDGHVDDLVDLIDSDLLASTRDEGVILFGHSLGGTIALAAASQRPSIVRSVIVHEPPLPWTDWWPLQDENGLRLEDVGVDQAVQRIFSRTTGTATWEDLPLAVREKRLAEGPAMISELVSARRRRPYDPAQLTMPCLISRGSQSFGHRERAQRELLAELPNATAHVVIGAGHNVQSSHPRETTEMVVAAVHGGGRRFLF